MSDTVGRWNGIVLSIHHSSNGFDALFIVKCHSTMTSARLCGGSYFCTRESLTLIPF